MRNCNGQISPTNSSPNLYSVLIFSIVFQPCLPASSSRIASQHCLLALCSLVFSQFLSNHVVCFEFRSHSRPLVLGSSTAVEPTAVGTSPSPKLRKKPSRRKMISFSIEIFLNFCSIYLSNNLAPDFLESVVRS